MTAQRATGRRGKDADRRARVEQMRKEAKAKELRGRLLFGGAVGLVLVILAGVIAVAVVRDQSSKRAQVLPAAVAAGDPLVQPPLRPGAPDPKMAGVVTYDTTWDPQKPDNDPANTGISHAHVPGPVTYSVTPPVGGPHNATWANAGIYTEPVVNELAVHLLEHGGVWVTYRRSLPADQVATIATLVKGLSTVKAPQGQDLGSPYVLVSPWADDSLAGPVVVTAWGRQLALPDPSDPRLKEFIEAFRADSQLSNEVPGEMGGVPVDVGGRPATTL